MRTMSMMFYNSSSSECSAQGQVFHCKCRNQGCSSAEGRSSTTNSGTKIAVLPEMNRCGSFPLLSAPHSLFSIWKDLKRSQGPQRWRWGEWIWLTGPSGLHRTSLNGLNISSIRDFDQIRDPEIPVTLRPHFIIIDFLKYIQLFICEMHVIIHLIQIYQPTCFPKNRRLIHIKQLYYHLCLCSCETWTLVLREEQRLSKFENKAFRKILWEKKLLKKYLELRGTKLQGMDKVILGCDSRNLIDLAQDREQ